MHIFSNTVVTLNYQLYDADGELIEASPSPITYLHGGYRGIFPKVEEALAQKQVGDSCSITLEPEDAFGEYESELVRVELLERFPPDIAIGMQFEGAAEEGPYANEPMVYTVTEIAEGKVVVDANHPLAGRRLRFDCTVVDVRPATEEEISHRHVHGPHGHHH